MPKSSIPAAGEAMLAVKGQLIPFHPTVRQFEPIGIPEDFIPDGNTVNQRYLIAARLALHTCNKNGAELLSLTKALSEKPEALDDMHRNWEDSAAYFDLLIGVIQEARLRIETCAEVAGIKAERGGVMLKPLHEAELSASLPADAYLQEGALSAGAFFSGVRTVVLNGIAHLIFFAEQSGADGGIEHVVVARLVAPEMRAAACLTHAALHIAKGPAAIGRPAN